MENLYTVDKARKGLLIDIQLLKNGLDARDYK